MVGAVILLISAGVYIMKPRGIRNNNPGNIRHSADKWQGMAEQQNDKNFVTFVDPKWGIRAIAKILDTYNRRGIVYLADIIETWAPPVENDTLAYITFVENRTKIWGNQRVSRADYPKLIEAIITMENGKHPYTMTQIIEGVNLA